jgi:hypothetical protein
MAAPRIGNVDYTDWFELDHSLFVKNADSVFDAFDEACHNAGPAKCHLWAHSPSAVQERRDNLLESLKRNPVLVPAWATPTGPDMPLLVTYGLVQLMTRGMIYAPLANAPRMARIYAALERGDGIPYYESAAELARATGGPLSEQLCSVTDMPATEPRETPMELDALSAIMCSDGEPVSDTPDEFARYVQKMRAISRWAGAASVYFRLPCVGRTVRPAWRFVPGGKSPDGPGVVGAVRPVSLGVKGKLTPLCYSGCSDGDCQPYPLHRELVRQCHTARERAQ